MNSETDLHERTEQLGLTEKDKQDLERAGLRMFEKIVNDYPTELPDIVVLPDTSARPLAYIADEVFGKIAKERGVKKPTLVFFWVHFLFEKAFVQRIVQENAELMSFENYLSNLDMSNLHPETQERFRQVRMQNSARAKQILEVFKKKYGGSDNIPTVISIDDQIGYVGTTTRELSVAFGDVVPTYGFVSMFDDNHYQEHGIPVKTGLVTARKTFGFRKDKDAIGFYKDDFYTKDLYPLYKYDDDNDTEKRIIKMMYLRDDMREIGRKIAGQIDSHSVWSEEDFVELKDTRDLKDEDLHEIEALAKLPKNIALTYHNYFSLNSDRIVSVIKRDIDTITKKIESENDQETRARLEREKIYLEIFERLSQKYDSSTLWNINIVLERRKVRRKN